MTKRTKVAVVGVGALGQHHARVYAELPEAELVGVLDQNRERAAEIAARHGCPLLPDLAAVAASAEAVSVAVPTVDHHRVGLTLLAAGRHVLVEKPIATSLEQADELIAAARSAGVRLQVGHVERFNPALDIVRTVARAP